MKLSRYFFFVIILFQNFAVNAELDFSTIVTKVRDNSELLISQRLKIDSADARARQAGAWQNPFLYGEFGKLQDTQNDSLTYEFRLTQPFYFPGKTGKAAALYHKEKEIEEITLSELKSALALEAVYFAFSHRIAELKTEHNDGRVKRFSLIKTFMRNRSFVSPQKRIERNIVANQLITLQKDLNFSVAERRTLWAKLNLYLNEPSEQKIAAQPIETLDALSEAIFLKKVLAGNYEILKKKKILERAHAELAVQKSIASPDIQATLYFRRENLAHPGANQFFGAGLTVPIPVVNANAAGIESAELKVKSLESELTYLEREITQEAKALFAEYDEKRALLAGFKEKDIDSLEQQMRFADREFKLGRVDLISYLGLEVQTHDTLHSYYETQKDLVRIITRMIFMQGKEVEFTGDLNVYRAG